MTNAVMVKCPNGDDKDHFYYDGCWFCAPYWINIPTCPVSHKGQQPGKRIKLNPSGWCKICKKYYHISTKELRG